VVLPEGIVVGALAVVNAAGVPVFPGAGAGDVGAAEGEAEIAQEAASAGEGGGPGAPSAPGALNTTLVVVATNAYLTPAECKRLATAAHAGLARALDPSHTLVDGDTVFGVSTRGIEFDRSSEAGRVVGLMSVQVAAANAVREAILDGVRSARAVTTPAGTWERFPVP
jgi:L-aminopeptidase/D-esterase-like protein